MLPKKDKKLVIDLLKAENVLYGKVVSHSGGWAGYTSYMERHVDNDKTIIILQNYATTFDQSLIKNVRQIIYNEN